MQAFEDGKPVMIGKRTVHIYFTDQKVDLDALARAIAELYTKEERQKELEEKKKLPFENIE